MFESRDSTLHKPVRDMRNASYHVEKNTEM